MLAYSQAVQHLNRYLGFFPKERTELSALISQLEEETDVFNRGNMRGHITTSTLVIDPIALKTLLIHHKLYNRWIQPGGHNEEAQALWLSACRELDEETALPLYAAHPWYGRDITPFDIDTHAIAAQPKRNEGPHFHHDYLYLVTADSRLPLIAQKEEVFAAAWEPLSKLKELGGRRFHKMLNKLPQIGIVF